MMTKRGQTATEYLIILAVVIVIALIVVGVLGGIPSIGGGVKANTLNSYWKTSEIGVSSMSVGASSSASTQNGNGTVQLVNNRAGTITITGIQMTDISSGLVGVNESDVVLAAGGSNEFVFMDLTNSGQAGETYTYGLLVNYTDSSTGAQYQFDGDGNNLEGTIASSVDIT